jgi:hypothetical protein
MDDEVVNNMMNKIGMQKGMTADAATIAVKDNKEKTTIGGWDNE